MLADLRRYLLGIPPRDDGIDVAPIVRRSEFDDTYRGVPLVGDPPERQAQLRGPRVPFVVGQSPEVGDRLPLLRDLVEVEHDDIAAINTAGRPELREREPLF